jgi:hypothetical protein
MNEKPASLKAQIATYFAAGIILIGLFGLILLISPPKMSQATIDNMTMNAKLDNLGTQSKIQEQEGSTKFKQTATAVMDITQTAMNSYLQTRVLELNATAVVMSTGTAKVVLTGTAEALGTYVHQMAEGTVTANALITPTPDPNLPSPIKNKDGSK